MVRVAILLSLFATHAALAGAALPAGPLIAGYQNWNSCNKTATLQAVKQGLNVVIWFAVAFDKAPDPNNTRGRPIITHGPDPKCVAEVRRAIEAQGVPTAHLISVGGWDAPWPDTTFNGTEWFEAFQAWNGALPMPYDGIDWDLEGNDWAEVSAFTPAVLNLVVDMSVAAKAAGLLVTLVPCQSYFDQTTSGFDLSLKHAYEDWHPEFHYRGRNGFAYLFAAAAPGTFDLVIVQLYETWSRAGQALYQRGQAPALYLKQLASDLLAGWTVDFGNNTELRLQGRHMVKLTAKQLILAFSFGWGGSVFFFPQDVGQAYTSAPAGARPRGYAFWQIELDGQYPANGGQSVLNLTAGLNAFLHTRRQPS